MKFRSALIVSLVVVAVAGVAVFSISKPRPEPKTEGEFSKIANEKESSASFYDTISALSRFKLLDFLSNDNQVAKEKAKKDRLQMASDLAGSKINWRVPVQKILGDGSIQLDTVIVVNNDRPIPFSTTPNSVFYQSPYPYIQRYNIHLPEGALKFNDLSLAEKIRAGDLVSISGTIDSVIDQPPGVNDIANTFFSLSGVVLHEK
jgi:hypothetical protein